MLMDVVLERFIAHSPMTVAVRGAFKYALSPTPRDNLFVRTVGHRDDRQLLFSTCADLMATVVCRVKPSVHAAYQAEGHILVNVTAVYARLARVPAVAGRELVRHTADRLGPVIRAMGGAEPDPLPGYRVKVPDGNHLGKTQRRLEPLRDVVAGPLPDQTLVARQRPWDWPSTWPRVRTGTPRSGPSSARSWRPRPRPTCGSRTGTSAPPDSCSGSPGGRGSS